jgi:hypothetical protein
MPSGLSGIVAPFLCYLTYIIQILSVIAFYWGLGLPIELSEWSTCLLPEFLLLVGVLTVLAASWRALLEDLSGSKRLSRLLVRVKIGRKIFGMLLGWEIVSATYLLANLGLATIKLFDFTSFLFTWQDSIFYALLLSQLASSTCVVVVAGLIGRFA